MTYSAFVDPGKHGASIAIVDGLGQLRFACMVELSLNDSLRPHRVAAMLEDEARLFLGRNPGPLDEVTIERMQHNATTKRIGAHEDILDVQLTGGACGAILH